MNKLKDIKKERIVIFDLDDTLIKTDAKIKIVSRVTKKVIREMTPDEFNSFENNSSHILNFDDFDCPEILRQGEFIHFIFNKLKNYYSRGIPVSILTARSSSDLVRNFFLHNKIDIHPDLVIAINDPKFNYNGNIAERKQKAISDIIDSGYTNLTFFDDNDENLRLAMEVNGYMGAKIKLVKVD